MALMLKVFGLVILPPLLIAIIGLWQKAEDKKIMIALPVSVFTGFIGLLMEGLAHMDCANNCVTGTNQSVMALYGSIIAFDVLLISIMFKTLPQRTRALIISFLGLLTISLFILSISISGGA